MPTVRGWTCLVFGVIFIVAGRLLGPLELYILGGIMLALLIVAIAISLLRPLRLGVARSVSPPRLHVGSVGRVEVAIRNGSTRSPVMRMTDHVEGTSGAQLLISPLDPNEVTQAAYRLPTERRGIVALGPASFEASDPFGLTTRRFVAASPGQLVVYPEVIPIPPAPPSPATERRSMSDAPEFLGGRSEEFHALRNYVPGDDIRRINWGASARHDELIVREDEAPTQNHLTVILDNAAMPSVLAVDRGATIAASLVSTMRNRSDPFRLISVDGQDTGFVLGQSGVEKALSLLAVVDPVARDDRATIATRDALGAVVVVTTPTGTITRQELAPFSRIMFVTMAPSIWDSQREPTPSSTEVSGSQIRLNLGSLDDLAGAWTRSIATLLSSNR